MISAQYHNHYRTCVKNGHYLHAFIMYISVLLVNLQQKISMPSVIIRYHKESNTFIAQDEHQNAVSYKEDRTLLPTSPVSKSATTSPMIALLMSLGACSGIDIVMILAKQRQDFDDLIIEISAEREHGLTPALWITCHLKYLLKGSLDLHKAEKAAALSVDKYCSVAETLRRSGCEISYEVELVGK